MRKDTSARGHTPGVAAVYLPLADLRPNPRNPRAHGDEVVRLARTILRTTWGAPILAQASTRRIIGGHGRLEAAKLIVAGLEVDGILRGGADHLFDRDAPGPGMVPVRLVDVSDAEADAMTLADNARALQGVDDAAAVVAMATRDFARDAAVMADMGYGAAELDALVKSAGDAVLASAPTTGTPVDNATEWQGMPEYESQDKGPHRTLIVHFADDAAVASFADLLGVTIAEKTKFTWYPHVERRDLASLAYVGDADDA
jgi:hypothetical protein